MAIIALISPEGRKDIPLAEHNTVGRRPSNTVQVLDRIVSKEHLHIDKEGDSYILKDLGSLNGTFVNGRRVTRKALVNGDEITLGATTLIFKDGAEPVKANTPSVVPLPLPSRVAINRGGVESLIQKKLGARQQLEFVPERQIEDNLAIRRDYERLRAAYEVTRAIGAELEVDKLLSKMLDYAFQLLPADRGVVLLYDADQVLQTRCVRTRDARDAAEISLSSTLINEVLKDRAAVLSSDASVDSRFQSARSIIMQGIRSTMAVPLIYSDVVFGLMVVDSQIATNAFNEKDLQLFQSMASQAAIMLQNSLYAEAVEREAVTRERFQRLLSPAIVEQVLDGKVEIAKGGELRDTTILFTDIRGFTAMSESRSPQRIVDMLNEYFELMVEIIFKHEGTLDKFVGDEIMALYGAPVGHVDDPQRAIRTALEMWSALELFNKRRRAAGEDPLTIGAGITSGEVVAGYLGSSKTLEYTVIGDVVNTGARLCALAKPGQILISEDTYHRVKDDFVIEKLPATFVKGKKDRVAIYRVLGEKEVRAGATTGQQRGLATQARPVRIRQNSAHSLDDTGQTSTSGDPRS